MKKSEIASPLARNDKVIVALDTPKLSSLKTLLDQLDGVISYYKIGLELFTALGWPAVDLVKKKGNKIFLDLKLHDIPNTVSKTAAVICGHDVDMFNVHALGGFEMMKKTREAVDSACEKNKKPLVIAVTILTSHDQQDLKKIGINEKIENQVLNLAELAQSAGLDGVVSSPQEISAIRKKMAKDFLIVTPGIRPAGSAMGDQKRTFDPKEAFSAGASYIVVGRPITEAENPGKAAASIIQSL